MNATQELWLPVVGWETLYEVSDHGRVRSVGRVVPWGTRGSRRILPRILKPGRNHKGVQNVGLSNGGTLKRASVHLLVLEAFVGPRPPGMVGCHWDDDKENNRLENLRWDTPSANEQDKLRNGGHRKANQTHCKRHHEFTSENTMVSSRGTRSCRRCHNSRRRAKVPAL